MFAEWVFPTASLHVLEEGSSEILCKISCMVEKLAGWGNQNDGHELSCEHGPHLTPKAERKELLFTHSFTYSFSFVQQKF